MSHEQDRPDTETAAPAYELGLWLRAVRSFLDIRNHPLSQAERAELPARDFANEARIAQDVLFRCSQLLLGLTRGGAASPFYGPGEEELTPEGASFGLGGGPASDGADVPLTALANYLNDASGLLSALLAAPAVGFGGWSGLANLLARELDHSAAVRKLGGVVSHRAASGVSPSLLAITEKLTPDAFAADMGFIFSILAHLLEPLRLIENSLTGDRPLKQTLPVFTLIRDESRRLLGMIENRAMHTEGVAPDTLDALDATAYALRMELRKTFEHELVGVAAMRSPTLIFAKVETSHGLLRDCFQQSIIALAQIFEPEYDAKQLFSTLRTKLEQSLALRRDLWGLLQFTRRAGESPDQWRAPMLERLGAFHQGSMRALIYKDWESFERFIEEVESARAGGELGQVLHRFEAYLETLFGQVNMRAVLANLPFDPAAEAA